MLEGFLDPKGGLPWPLLMVCVLLLINLYYVNELADKNIVYSIKYEFIAINYTSCNFKYKQQFHPKLFPSFYEYKKDLFVEIL